MKLTETDQWNIIRTDGEAVPNALVEAILDAANENRFSYDEPGFKRPYYRDLYWFRGRLFATGTHGEVTDVTTKYWPVTRHLVERRATHVS